MASYLLHSILLAASVTQTAASCAYGTYLHPRAEEGATVKINTFGYTSTQGPFNWANLDASGANSVCATGTNQSPIDMVSGNFNMVAASDVKLDIADFTEGAEFENLGTTVEVVAENGTLEVGGKTYELKQFHFHLPSEHLDNGTVMAMEMHMVFESEAQELAVIGVYIDIDTAANASSSIPETVLSKVADIATPGSTAETEPLAMSGLVSTLLAGSFQGYPGSLTTPPCSEGVTWLVSTQQLLIQPTTYFAARSVIQYNARYPQNNPGQPNLLSLSANATKAA